MKVLILCTEEIKGGAAIAANRLHRALISEGIDSKMLVLFKDTSDNTVVENKKNLIFIVGRILKFILVRIEILLYKIKSRFYKSDIGRTELSSNYFYFSTIFNSSIYRIVNRINPDIVHLHWVARGLLKESDLHKIKAPLIWSLHDMLPFTGGCFYDKECGRYTKSCGKCVVLGSKKEYDLSSIVFNKKRKNYSKIQNLTIIGLSTWIAKCAERSTLFQGRRVLNLPNCINTDVFKPIGGNKKEAEKFHIDKSKKTLLLASFDSFGYQRKGLKEFLAASHQIKTKDIQVVIIGSRKSLKMKSEIEIIQLNIIENNDELTSLLNCVDLLVVPSLQENLSNIILEGLSCGTPVVAFDIGGNGDMIEHKNNGYLAKPFDTTELAFGIDWVLKNNSDKSLSVNARNKVLNNFDSKKVSKEYIELYSKIIG